jgi:predicted DNA-binding protein
MMSGRPKRNTKITNFRLTDECRRLLALLSEDKGVSQAAVVELLVREEAKRTDVEESVKLAA